MDIVIEASVFPTEDPGLVTKAILNIFPAALGNAEGGRLRMTAPDAAHLARRISEQRIRDTARAVLVRSVSGNCLRFCLNKQAALVGRVNFTECGSALGDIEVRIECDEVNAEIVRIAGGPK